MLKFSKRNKLHNIPRHILFILFRIQGVHVSIEGVHAGEVSVAYADYDDGERENRPSNYLVDGLLHVVDDAVRDNQQNLIVLIIL